MSSVVLIERPETAGSTLLTSGELATAAKLRKASSMSKLRRVVAREDAALGARVVEARPLHYSLGGDVSEDRPAHVRAGSALGWAGGRIAVIQDDANFVAIVDPTSGQVDALALARGADGARCFDERRGTKPSSSTSKRVWCTAIT